MSDAFDDYDSDQQHNEHDDENDSCVDGRLQLCGCGRPTAFESCGFCGEPLCPMCFETGGGFCSQNHTQEQIDAYAEAVYGVVKSPEQKQAREELKQMKLL